MLEVSYETEKIKHDSEIFGLSNRKDGVAISGHRRGWERWRALLELPFGRVKVEMSVSYGGQM